MTPRTAKSVTMAIWARSRGRLHPSIRDLECFQLWALKSNANSQNSWLESIPFLNDSKVLERLRAVESDPTFKLWVQNPYTGEVKSVQMELPDL